MSAALVLPVSLLALSCGAGDDTVAPERVPTSTSGDPGPASTATAAPGATPTPDGASPADVARVSFTDGPTTDNDVLVLYGRVLDTTGEPASDAVVEIWQTDAGGVYDHPDDQGTQGRDQAFQFFGSATTDENGWYAFRTILPGQYEPRPRHIHFKVKQGATTVLTSQFYFQDSADGLADDRLVAGLGDDVELLLLDLDEQQGVQLAAADIIVDLGRGGELDATPSQGEGPYYPVVDVGQYDNDLAVVP